MWEEGRKKETWAIKIAAANYTTWDTMPLDIGDNEYANFHLGCPLYQLINWWAELVGRHTYISTIFVSIWSNGRFLTVILKLNEYLIIIRIL